MKIIISLLFYTVFIFSSCCTSLAQSPTTQKGRPNVVLMSETEKKSLLLKTGGTITSPSSGPYILFVDMQTFMSEQVLQDSAMAIHRMTRLPVETRKCMGDPMPTISDELKKKDVGAIIALCDSTQYPTLLIAPENRWALVNIQALKNGADGELLKSRTRKEVWRALGSLMGAGNNGLDYCVMKAISSPIELDEIKAKSIGPESLSKVLFCAAKLGIKSSKSTTYRKACEEGWAPTPTNEIQKTVWDDVKKQQSK